MSNVKSVALGIDLGTTYSCAAVFERDKVEIIVNDYGNRTTPSCVAFTNTERLIGEAAKTQQVSNPENTIYEVKRLIGRRFNDPNVQNDIQNLPFKVINKDDRVYIEIQYKGQRKLFLPEEISSMILYKIKEIAENCLGKKITNAVITVPVYFNDAQRKATKDAGTLANFNVLRIINESTAAALAYGLDNNIDTDKIILIFDLGGGTFNVSILHLSKGPVFVVMATNGDTNLGGEDFDDILLKYFAKEFYNKFGLDILSNQKSISRLRAACENAKRILSTCNETNIEIDSLYEGNDFYFKLTRARFNELCFDLFKRTLTLVDLTIKDAKLEKENIDEIILSGGSTRIVKIRQMLQNYFTGKELNMTINPDEAIAYGAAIQAAILNEDSNTILKDVLLIDITPLSLGVETVGGIMSIIIPRNSHIPCKAKNVFSPYETNQKGVTIHIYEGERSLTKDNNYLGSFELINITPAPRGIPRIEVNFDIDANGLLTVSACDTLSGIQNDLSITSDEHRLSKEEIDVLVVDAERYREDDERLQKGVEAYNKLESFALVLKRKFENTCKDFPENNEVIQYGKECCEEILKWLGEINAGDIPLSDYESRQRELGALYSNILNI